jgi:hypothetical protein
VTPRRTRSRVAALLLTAALALALPACAADDTGDTGDAGPAPAGATAPAEAATGSVHEHSTEVPRPRALREGERRLTLSMEEPYAPSAPTGVGSDDYRCFLLDPDLARDAFITGTTVLPGNRDAVHHVILFRVPPEDVAAAEEADAEVDGPGWTCFGGSGVAGFTDVDDAQWLGAWAPGGRESVLRPGLGTRLEKGSRIVMQVHYNLLAGDEPDVSATQLRLAGGGADIEPLGTMLMPAPVELPCRPGHDDSELCDRDAAMADVQARFGLGAGNTADALHYLCPGEQRPGATQSCTRSVDEPMTIQGVAGHMHLLGRSIRIEVNPGTDEARTILDIPVWDFDDQGARAIEPVRLDPYDEVKVTCRHAQWLRDELPAFEGQEERYVVWGEGTTDEMCLGILQVTRG